MTPTNEVPAGSVEGWAAEWRQLLKDKTYQDALLATAGLMETQQITPECRANRSVDGAWNEAVRRLREIYDAQVAHDPTLTIGLSIGRLTAATDPYADADLDPDTPRLLAEARKAKPEAEDWFCRKCGMHRDEHAPGGLKDQCSLDPYLTTASEAWTNVEENR